MSQWTTGPFGGGTSMCCSTITNERVFAGAPVHERAGEGAALGLPVGAHVFSAGSVSPSRKPAAVSVKPGVGVPWRAICGITTGLPAASGLGDAPAAGLVAGLAAG